VQCASYKSGGCHRAHLLGHSLFCRSASLVLTFKREIMSPPHRPTTDLATTDRVLSWPLWRGLTGKLHAVTRPYSPGPMATIYRCDEIHRANAFWPRGRCAVIIERPDIQRGVWVRIGIERSAREAYMAAQTARVEAGQLGGFGLHFDYPHIHSVYVDNVATFQWVKRELARLKRVCDMF
jgi:hypothetical protein